MTRNLKYIFSIIVVLQLLLLFQSANTLANEKCLKSNFQNEYNIGSNNPNYLNNLHSLPAENSHLIFSCTENSNKTNNSIFIEAEEQIPDEKIIMNYFSAIPIMEFQYKYIFNIELSVFIKDFGFVNYSKLSGRFIRD